MGPAAINAQEQVTTDEWDGRMPQSSPPSLIQNLPETAKLIIASLFVALVVHLFLASRRTNNVEGESPTVHGGVGAVGAIEKEKGEANIDHGRSSSSENTGAGQILGDSDTTSSTPAAEADNSRQEDSANKGAKKGKKQSSRNAKIDRNYDALICKAEDTEEDLSKTRSQFNSTVKSQQKSTPKKNKKKKSTQPNRNKDENANNDSTTIIVDDTASDQPMAPAPPPPIELKSQANHPGLQGYYNWHATITSLYRIYAIPSHDKIRYHQAILPMHPSSERGNVPLYVEVTNHTSQTISVYWIDYKGNEVYKGTIQTRGTWSQTTFIGHPWTFRIGDGEENVLLKYAPFRVVPTIVGAETSRVESNNGNVEGVQKFVINNVPEDHVTRLGGLTPVCLVEDKILPEPPLIQTSSLSSASATSTAFTTVEIQNAVEWSCQQIQREDAIYHGKGIASAKRLLQYLKKICLHPDDPKYRKLRLGNRIFQETIYNTGARGVLLAVGFEELYGNMECGPSGGKMLPHERIQHISDAMMVVSQALKVMEGGYDSLVQPEGGDGFGRAGFGHAGGMNL